MEAVPIQIRNAGVVRAGRERSGGGTTAQRRMVFLDIKIKGATGEDMVIAADAVRRFGRANPAGLNLGDCFADALARPLGTPLLFKGNDFGLSDIAVVEVAGAARDGDGDS